MKLHPTVTKRAPRLGFVTDVETDRKAREEGGEYRYERISLEWFACIHEENVYVIEVTGDTFGCSCQAMTYGKTHSDACKHITALSRLDLGEMPPVSEEIKKLLRWEGWIGETTLIPPAAYSTQAGKKKEKRIPIHDPERKPGRKAEDRDERRRRYESMTQDEIVRSLPLAELETYANRGAPNAIKELERRMAERAEA
jgi:hypothetical protein